MFLICIIEFDEFVEEASEIAQGIMSALSQSLNNVDLSTTKGDVIIQQEEKEVDEEGNITIKERTLRNPTQEEIDRKTIDELATDNGEDVTTIRSFKIKLTDNDFTDHAFSNFGLDNPKSAKSSDKQQESNYLWYTIKMTCIFGIGFIMFAAYRSYLNSNIKLKRRYHSTNTGDDEDSDENDEEELRNIRNAMRRGVRNDISELKEDVETNY